MLLFALGSRGAIVCSRLTVAAAGPAAGPPLLLLDGFSATFRPGRLVGVLGPSGAGKTTLLTALAGHRRPAGPRQLFFDGAPLDARTARRRFAYLSQEDVLPAFLTVHEYLCFCARLVEGPGVPAALIRNSVDVLLQRLGLLAAAAVRIGDGNHGTRRGISGGQRRRTSIAAVLIRAGRLKDSQGCSEVQALIMDEPLSGLDSQAAEATVAELRASARGVHAVPNRPQRIVLMSLHQPSARLFGLLDQVVVVGSDHRALFVGTPAEAEHVFHPGVGASVSEVIIEVAARGRRETRHASPHSPTGSAVSSERKYETTSLAIRNGSATAAAAAAAAAADGSILNGDGHDTLDLAVDAALARLGASSAPNTVVRNDGDMSVNMSVNNDASSSGLLSSLPSSSSPSPSSSPKARCCHQVRVLAHRASLRLVRKPLLLRLHTVVTLVAAGGISTLWANTGEKHDFEGLHNRMGVLFFCVCFFGFSSLSALTVFLEERNLFVRERAAQLYGVSAYVAVEALFDLVPLRVIPPLLLGSLVYLPVGLRTDVPVAFPRFLLLLVLANTSFACASMCLGACASSTPSATFAGGLFMLLFLAFGGVFLSLRTLPPALAWMPYLTPSRFAYDGLVKNELVNATFAVSSGSSIPGLGELTVHVGGEQVLHQMGFSKTVDEPFAVDVVALLCVPLGYLVVGWCVVLFQHKIRTA